MKTKQSGIYSLGCPGFNTHQGYWKNLHWINTQTVTACVRDGGSCDGHRLKRNWYSACRNCAPLFSCSSWTQGSQGVSHNRFCLNIFDDPLLHNEIDQAFNSGAEFGGFYTHSHWEMNANEIWTMSENSKHFFSLLNKWLGSVFYIHNDSVMCLFYILVKVLQ